VAEALPTVVLLHSSASSARQWDALAAALRPRFQVHAIELHGHGARPPWPDERPLTLADEAALVEPALAARGGVHLVGHSYGGAVALKLAALHPRRVCSLVAYEPVLARWLAADPAGAPLAQGLWALAAINAASIAAGETTAAARRFVEFWSGAEAWAMLSGERQRAVAARMPAVQRQFDALAGEPMAPQAIAALRLPMLLLSGSRTAPAARHTAALLRRALPAARHETLADMGHMGPISHAAQVNWRIAQFLHTRAQLGAAVEPSLESA
jgi:pimeloyl-ACP methyl ester carboxylesterase